MANPIETFANFTFEEWVAALARAMGDAEAREYVNSLFATARLEGTGVFGLQAEAMALLARLGPTAEARIAQMVGDAEGGQAHVDALRKAYDRYFGRRA